LNLKKKKINKFGGKMNKEEERQFFAMKVGEPHRISMNGKRVSLNNFPEDTKKEMMNRLAEKDEVMKQGQSGIVPGMLINGKQVTKENIKEIEIRKEEPVKTKESIKEVPKIEPKEKPKAEKTKKTKRR